MKNPNHEDITDNDYLNHIEKEIRNIVDENFDPEMFSKVEHIHVDVDYTDDLL